MHLLRVDHLRMARHRSGRTSDANRNDRNTGAGSYECSAIEQRMYPGPILALTLGKQDQRLAPVEYGDATRQRFAVCGPTIDRKGAERREEPPETRVLPHLLLAHESDASRAHTRHDRAVDVAAVHRGQHVGAGRREVFSAVDVQASDRLREPAHQRADDSIGDHARPRMRGEVGLRFRHVGISPRM